MTRSPDSPADNTVVLVDDHRLFAESVGGALVRDGMTVIRVDPFGKGVVHSIAQHRPSLVVMDIAFGSDPVGGIRLIEPLCDLGLKVLVLTGSTDRSQHADALIAGALGVIDKAESLESFVDAVRRALAGESVMSLVSQNELIIERERARRREKGRSLGLGELTPRESLVLALLLDGLQAGAIAHAHNMSISTVRSHIRSILVKLGVHSQVEAVSLALRAGWSHRGPRDAS